MAKKAWIAATLAFMGIAPFWLGLERQSAFWLLLVSAAVVATRRPAEINYRLLKDAQENGYLRRSIFSVFGLPWLVIAAVLIAPYGLGYWLGLGSAG